jgi:hypothetical protein
MPFKARQEEVHAFARRQYCHKYLTSKNTGLVVHEKGRKARLSAPHHRITQRAKRWPKLCLGETYAGLFFSRQGCSLGLFLILIRLVASGQSSD